MNPTPEQEDCITKFGTGKSLKINALAGTGKTSTMTMLAGSTNRRGLYICFNKAIAEESKKKFPGMVTCSTTHGLAFRGTVKTFGVQKMTSNINGGIVAAKMNCKPRTVTNGGAVVMQLSPRNWGFLVSETVKRWTRSDRDEISACDVPLDGKLGKLEEKLQGPIVADVVKDARKIWERMIDPSNDMPMGHDSYLKAWQLTRPYIDAEYIMLDEAQDTSPVVQAILRNQSAQVILCGDRFQELYAWRGAVNAMRDMPSDLESRLSTSFRFGEAIANYATGILRLMDDSIAMRGNPAKESSVGPIDRPTTILCRTNARLIETVFDLVEKRKRPHIVGGVDEAMAWVKGAESLMAGRPVERPIELFGFQSWDDVRMVAEMDQDADLQRWVRFIDQHGPDKLRSTLERLPKNERDADVVLCTGHKSKGREWESVELSSDFLMGIKTRDADPDKSMIIPMPHHESELCLFYVAATRGMRRLAVHPELQDRVAKLTRGLESRKAAEALASRKVA